MEVASHREALQRLSAVLDYAATMTRPATFDDGQREPAGP
jgi:hypothetical protein